jgi:hypothetical protein
MRRTSGAAPPSSGELSLAGDDANKTALVHASSIFAPDAGASGVGGCWGSGAEACIMMD